MTTRTMTFRLPLDLAQVIEDQASVAGSDRTAVVVAALTQYWGLPLPVPAPVTLAALQQHMGQLETSMNRLTEHVAMGSKTPLRIDWTEFENALP